MKKDLMPAPSKLNRVLDALGKREAVLTAQIQSVVQGYTNACFVYGPGGLGKTHLIVTALEAMTGKGFRHHTAYSTPKALMLALVDAPDTIHLFEDCEKMYKTDVSSSILRAACGSPKQRDRWVTYETAHEILRVNFTGGMVIVSNENLAKASGPLSAVASRFKPIKWDLTTEERVARILQIAGLGWARQGSRLTPPECLKVAKFLVLEMTEGRANTPVDIRTYTEHALPAYSQWKDGRTTVDWTEIIKSKLSGEVNKIERRGERNDRLGMLAMSISKEAKLTRIEKLAKWKAETGLGMVIYYRHLKANKVR